MFMLKIQLYQNALVGKMFLSLTQVLNQDLKRLDEWSARNKMFINSQKTKSMLMTGKRLRNLVASTSIDVSLNGSNIEHVTDFKLLGITLDQDLSGI